MKDDPGSGRPTSRASADADRRPARPALSSGAEFAGLGLQFAGSLCLFGLLGWWLDRKLGTTPWLLILLIFVGAGAAFYSMYRRVFGESRSGRAGGARRERDRR
jgi:F0F1-type ATP synthase assembly protein I